MLIFIVHVDRVASTSRDGYFIFEKFNIGEILRIISLIPCAMYIYIYRKKNRTRLFVSISVSLLGYLKNGVDLYYYFCVCFLFIAARAIFSYPAAVAGAANLDLWHA